MYAIIGFVVGLYLYRLVFVPIIKESNRKKCKQEGLVPWDF